MTLIIKLANELQTLDTADSCEESTLAGAAGAPIDAIVLATAEGPIPREFWSAGASRIVMARDVRERWHFHRQVISRCELALIESGDFELLQGVGLASLWPIDRPCWISTSDSELPSAREIDVLCLWDSPTNSTLTREILQQLCVLGDRWNVSVESNLSGNNLRERLRRARVCVALSEQQNLAVALAAAAEGAVWCQIGDPVPAETSGRRSILQQWQAVPGELAKRLTHLLECEEDRAAIAAEARSKSAAFAFAEVWERIHEIAIEQWESIVQRKSRREPIDVSELALIEGWQAATLPGPIESGLTTQLEIALDGEPSRLAQLKNLLGALLLKPQDSTPPRKELLDQAIACFQTALRHDPSHIVAKVSLAESLAIAGRRHEAVDSARQALQQIRQTLQSPETLRDAMCLAYVTDPGFATSWEQAAWRHAGQPQREYSAKQQLLTARLHALLAKTTGDLADRYEAVLARPQFGPARRSLATALMVRGNVQAAMPHLQEALADNPLDSQAARVLYQCHHICGDQAGKERLSEEWRQLSQIASNLISKEDWFKLGPPTGRELASIIILCCNQVDFTRKCLDSLFERTRAPYELILVDNGSTDGTAAYLESIRLRPGPANVEIITNEQNLGFAAGCNQGLQRSRGEYVIFLNNDTELTAGWLDGLISATVGNWPTAGMVGPVTSYAPEPQGLRTNYHDKAGMEAFAASRRTEHAGRILDVDRLTGFCLLVRREVIDKIGGFDERFGLGFFEDDDLCVRAREQGYRLLVALDVFIHHFGSRTVRDIGIDSEKQLRVNFEQFRDKWGLERSAGYRPIKLGPPSPSVAQLQTEKQVDKPKAQISVSSQLATERPRVTVTMIVKNEEPRLGKCLESIAGIVDEVVVVDTGSSDGTREVAARYGAKVSEFPWVDSFAAARNEALRHATGKWILWLDADDRIDAPNRQRMRELFASLGDELDAYVMKVRSSLDTVNRSFRLLDQVRMFRNHPEIRWRYRVHEQILPSVRRVGGNCRWADVTIDHVGYQDPGMRKHKLDRNIRLLEMDNAERSGDAFTLFNLGWSYLDTGKTEEALLLLRRSLDQSQPDASIVRKLFALIVQAHRRLGRRDEALAAARDGLLSCPDDLELLLEKAMLQREGADFNGAEATLMRILNAKPSNYFASVDEGIRGYKTRHMLANLYREQGRAEEAEAQWRTAVAERPDFEPAWLGLGDLFLKQARWGGVDEAARRLEKTPLGVIDGIAMRTRMHMIRRNYGEARRVLEQAVSAFPGAVRLRVMLTHALLQEGRDWIGAERALRDVLAIEPGNHEARQNLRVLLRQQQRPMDEPILQEQDAGELAYSP